MTKYFVGLAELFDGLDTEFTPAVLNQQIKLQTNCKNK
jgi:hypothetical protein